MFKRKGTKNWYTHVRRNGKRFIISLETSNRADAGKREAMIKLGKSSGRFAGAGDGISRTFDELSERYLASCTVTKSSDSQERDRGIFKLHLVPFFGGKKLNDIDVKEISAYKDSRRSKKASAGTINKEFNLLKAAFNKAFKEWGWMSSNPCQMVRGEKEGSPRVRWLKEEELTKLFANASEWLFPIMLVVAQTGMRRGNIINLGKSELDFKNREIQLQTTKNGLPLTIPMTVQVYNALKGFVKTHHPRSKYVFREEKDTVASFRTRLHREFKAACSAAELTDFRWHDLRHDFASRLIQRGASIYMVKELLGHCRVNVTEKYAHLDSGAKHRAMEEFFGGDKALVSLKKIEGGK